MQLGRLSLDRVGPLQRAAAPADFSRMARLVGRLGGPPYGLGGQETVRERKLIARRTRPVNSYSPHPYFPGRDASQFSTSAAYSRSDRQKHTTGNSSSHTTSPVLS